jgi:lysophospholipid acyltransferase (LPLAT)-like uncharacterized protein
MGGIRWNCPNVLRLVVRQAPRSGRADPFPAKLQPVPYTPKQRFALAVIPPLAVLLIRLLGCTLRYYDVTAPGVTPGDILPGPSVYAFWHRSLLACAYRFRNKGIAILISRSFDGELIARTVELLGFHAIRGSSSRGGATGLRKMERAFRDGHRCAITADGPRGPAQIAKPGAAQLASLVGAPVGAFYALPERAWQLRTWDRFLIPKPFSRVAVTFPAIVPAGAPNLQSAIQHALDQSVAMALAVHQPTQTNHNPLSF